MTLLLRNKNINNNRITKKRHSHLSLVDCSTLSAFSTWPRVSELLTIWRRFSVLRTRNKWIINIFLFGWVLGLVFCRFCLMCQCVWPDPSCSICPILIWAGRGGGEGGGLVIVRHSTFRTVLNSKMIHFLKLIWSFWSLGYVLGYFGVFLYFCHRCLHERSLGCHWQKIITWHVLGRDLPRPQRASWSCSARRPRWRLGKQDLGEDEINKINKISNKINKISNKINNVKKKINIINGKISNTFNKWSTTLCHNHHYMRTSTLFCVDHLSGTIDYHDANHKSVLRISALGFRGQMIRGMNGENSACFYPPGLGVTSPLSTRPLFLPNLFSPTPSNGPRQAW